VKTVIDNCQSAGCREVKDALNDQLAELSYENRLLQREVRRIEQRRLFFARRQAAASAMIIFIISLAAALIINL
jgi:hypothetical protein